MPDTPPPGPPDIPDISGGGVTVDTDGGLAPFLYGPGGKAEAPDSPTKSGPIHYQHGAPDGPLPSLPDTPPPAAPADDGGTGSAPVTWGYTAPSPDPDADGYGYHPHIDLGVGPYHLDPIAPPQMPDDGGGGAQAEPDAGAYGQPDAYGDGGYGQADADSGYDDTYPEGGYAQSDTYADDSAYDSGAVDEV